MRRVLLAAVPLLLLGLAGCRLLAIPFLMFAPEPTEKVKAEYPYLDDKHLCVAVWADSNTLFEYPNVQLELSEHLAVALQPHIERVSFVPNRDVVDYQKGNPDWDIEDPSKLGGRFRADRVMLIELTQYSTREPGSPHLLRGNIAGAVKLYDAGLPKTDPLYRASVETVFPEDGNPQWGTSESDLRRVTMETFATTVARKFYDHEVKIK